MGISVTNYSNPYLQSAYSSVASNFNSLADKTYKITSEYGAVESVREGIHTGLDLAMVIGTKLRSVTDGEILRIFSGNDAIGKGVLVLGKNGREYIYGHMSKVNVKIGEEVGMGSLLGESGNTGNTTGPHLHFAVRENGMYINPAEYKTSIDSLSGNLTASDLPWSDFGGRVDVTMLADDKRNMFSGITDFTQFIKGVQQDGMFMTVYGKSFPQVAGDFLLDILREAGTFILRMGDLFFLLPAIAFMFATFVIGRNKFTKWILPLWFAYFVSTFLYKLITS